MKNLTKKIVVLFTAVFLSISLGSVSFADGHGKKILFSIKGPGSGNPFWASVTKGAEEEAKKLGVKLILIAPPQEGDVQAQINQVEDQLAKGVDALALAPGDPNAFAPIVDDAIKSGVPVVFVDTKGINEGVTFIGTNNMNGAEFLNGAKDSLGKYAAQQVTKGINNFITQGLKNNNVKTRPDWVNEGGTNGIPGSNNNESGSMQ